ncbi:MAG: hypothetical protein V2A58_14500 [Planctomycetota bacterium]
MSGIELLLIEPEALAYPATKRILSACAGAEVRVGDEGPIDVPPKRILRLRRHKGRFLKSWRAPRGEEPRGRYYLVQGVGCPADCEYCFLQEYHRELIPTFHVNLEEMEGELRERLAPCAMANVLAGELMDGLFLDSATGLSRVLHGVAKMRPGVTMELRTKTADVETLADLSGLANWVVAWTMSPPEVVDRYEPGTATFEKRVAGARQAASWGHRVGIRLDPVIRFDGWREAYTRVMERLADEIDARSIDKVVLGLLRFRPGLPECVEKRRGLSRLFLEEFVRCSDGKMRYLKFLRLEMLEYLLEKVRECFAGVPVEVSMETLEVRALLAERLGAEVAVECAGR